MIIAARDTQGVKDDEAPGGVSVSVLLAVTLVVLTGLSVPLIRPAPDSSLDGQAGPPLRVENASIDDDVAIVQSDFGGGTYHYTPIRITLVSPEGVGEIVVQIATPNVYNIVLSHRTIFRGSGEGTRTLSYQPSHEFRRKDIRQYPGDVLKTRVTVRIRTDGELRTIAERTVRVEVER